MQRYLTLKVVVSYPKGWTQPEVRDFLKNGASITLDKLGDREVPKIQTVRVERMITDYA